MGGVAICVHDRYQLRLSQLLTTCVAWRCCGLRWRLTIVHCRPTVYDCSVQLSTTPHDRYTRLICFLIRSDIPVIELSAGSVLGLKKSSRRACLGRRSTNQHAALIREMSKVGLSDIPLQTHRLVGMLSKKRYTRALIEYARCVKLPVRHLNFI